MANEITTTSADDLSYAAEILSSAILENFYGNLIGRPLVRYADISGFPSKAKDFPISPALAAASVAEGVSLVNTAFTTTKATVTAAEVGLMLTITDLLSASDVVDDGYYASQGGQALAAKFTTDVLAMGAGFANHCGATTVNLTEQNILDGLVTLASAGVPPPYAGVLHPRQWADLVADIGTTIAPAGGGGAAGARAMTNDLAVGSTGGLGTLYGVSWETSHLVPTATAGADRLGMIVNPQFAIGHVEKWAVRVEFERDAALRARSVVITACYGLGELRDAAGIGILSDA
jgi:hypothetical protein